MARAVSLSASTKARRSREIEAKLPVGADDATPSAIACALDRARPELAAGAGSVAPPVPRRSARVPVPLGRHNGKLLWYCHAGCSQDRRPGRAAAPRPVRRSAQRPRSHAGKARAKAADWRPLLPVPDDATAASLRLHDSAAGLPGALARRGRARCSTSARFRPGGRLPEGESCRYCYGTLDGPAWLALEGGARRPRPLYRLDLLAKLPPPRRCCWSKGEKVVTAARALLPDYAADHLARWIRSGREASTGHHSGPPRGDLARQ